MFPNTPTQLKQKKSKTIIFKRAEDWLDKEEKSTFKRTSFFKTVFMTSIWSIKLSPFIPCLINYNRIYADTYIVGSETSQWPGLSVGHNFLKGKEVSLPSSNRSTLHRNPYRYAANLEFVQDLKPSEMRENSCRKISWVWKPILMLPSRNDSFASQSGIEWDIFSFQIEFSTFIYV